MASLGKCTICTKTCYQLEGHRVGPPGKEIVFHKRCFKCQNEGCGWQLTLTSYKFCDGKVWCANHCPVRGFSNPDHCKPTFDTSALAVETAMAAPKLDTVNDQVRGASSAAPAVGMDSMHIARAVAAPKLDTVNDQVRLVCPSCNARATGKFCSSCGSQLHSELLQ